MFSRTVSVKIFGNNSKIVEIKKKLSTAPRIKVSDEVKWALNEKKPIVALESTIITHGMPYPDNVKCALEVEGIVRKQTAIPATVAIIEGEVKVGLSEGEIDTLGNTIRSKPVKTSRRDMSYVVSNKLNGGTTVSGTLLIAHKLGIPIFATGGIGGVHRGAECTFDVSGDLTELGKSNVAVVSSGVKSILDIAKTLEYLETQGVFVATFGENNDFPAFYSRNSGNKATYSIKTATEAAEIVKCNMELGMQSGMLFAVPIPEEYAIPNDIIDEVIEKALSDITGKVHGKEITPYLLSKVAELTKGRSLESNIALIKNNARVAADIAVALSNLSSNSICEDDSSERRKADSKGRPVIIGGSILDCSAKLDTAEVKLDGRTYDTTFTYKAGGVARNICESLYKLGFKSHFLTIVGDDTAGRRLSSFIPKDCSQLIKVTKNQNTSQCIVMFDKKGDCKLMVGDMAIHKEITKEMIAEHEGVIRRSSIMVLDANLTIEAIGEALKLADKYSVPVFYEPTDISHALKAFKTSTWRAIKFLTPNLEESKHIANFLNIPTDRKFETRVQEAAHIATQILDHIENVIVTLGSDGILIARRGGLASEGFNERYPQSAAKFVRHYPTSAVSNIKNVSGAGDSFASGFLAALISNKPEEVCVSVGFAAAHLALFSESAVPDVIFNRDHESWNKKGLYKVIGDSK